MVRWTRLEGRRVGRNKMRSKCDEKGMRIEQVNWEEE